MRDLIGRTLGHYRIVEKIGEGGMGEVYRAHDERLGRDVAIKVLREAVAQDADRLARFEREAKLLASLSHPNIATVHGLEREEGRGFFVMELVEGESLASVIARGAIPFDEALQISLQIAKALEAAHEHGVIHRDLKPANVMVGSEGLVKVLDFGLAKAFDPEGSGPQSAESLAESPTLTADLTRGGVLLGTASYMSPEQARGKPVDKRTDVWAFGCTLYEMLTGTRPFGGTSSTDVLAAIIKEEPEWDDLPADTPAAARRLLQRCLTKDPRDRLHDIADARIELEEAITEPHWASTEQAGQPEPTFRDWVRAVWPMSLAAVVVGALLAGGATWKFSEVRSTIPRPLMRLALNLPPGVTIHTFDTLDLAVSPDGRWLVFAAIEGDTYRLFKRSLEQFDATPIPGTEEGDNPFFSPDGHWVGFFAEGKLKKVGDPTDPLFSTAEREKDCGACPPLEVRLSSSRRRSSSTATDTQCGPSFSRMARRCCSQPFGE
jgi:serine/threonine protein kinase